MAEGKAAAVSMGDRGSRTSADLLAHAENYFFRYSNSLSSQLDAWAEEHCHKFEDEATEFTLEHTALHQRFCELFEDLLEQEIATIGFTVRDLYDALQDDELRGQQRTTFAQVLNAVVDFNSFAKLMADKSIGIDFGLSEAFAYPTQYVSAKPPAAARLTERGK
eukprot:g1834.t1